MSPTLKFVKNYKKKKKKKNLWYSSTANVISHVPVLEQITTCNKKSICLSPKQSRWIVEDAISDCRKWTLQLALKHQIWRLVFYLNCFEDKHIDFLLQVVICSSTGMWLITFAVDEYHRIFFFKIIFVIFTNLRLGDIIHSLYLLEI